MSIKVKHDGNVTSRIVASAQGGRGKRQAEDAKLLSTLEAQQQTADKDRMAKMASSGGGGGGAPSPHAPSASFGPSAGHAGGGGGSAPLVHASPGGNAPLITAHANAPTISAPVRPKDKPAFEVTGYDPNKAPDRQSVWNEQTGQWERGSVAYQNYNASLADERKLTAEQRREYDRLNSVYDRARRSGRYTPQELQQIYGQIETAKGSIVPLSQPPEESEQSKFDKRIITAGGQHGYVNSKGDFVPFQGGKSIAQQYAEYSKMLATEGQFHKRIDPQTHEEDIDWDAARAALGKLGINAPSAPVEEPAPAVPQQPVEQQPPQPVEQKPPARMSVTVNGRTFSGSPDEVLTQIGNPSDITDIPSSSPGKPASNSGPRIASPSTPPPALPPDAKLDFALPNGLRLQGTVDDMLSRWRSDGQNGSLNFAKAKKAESDKHYQELVDEQRKHGTNVVPTPDLNDGQLHSGASGAEITDMLLKRAEIRQPFQRKRKANHIYDKDEEEY